MFRLFPSTRVPRWLAGAFAIATLLLGLSADAAHLVLEQHEWCDAHAAIEHVADGGAHAEALDPHAEEGERFVRDSVPADEHSSCRLVELTREQDAVLARSERVRAPWTGSVLWIDGARDAPAPTIARYRVAPKNSPPVL